MPDKKIDSLESIIYNELNFFTRIHESRMGEYPTLTPDGMLTQQFAKLLGERLAKELNALREKIDEVKQCLSSNQLKEESFPEKNT